MTIYGFTYDYSKTMMMKLFMSQPDHKGGTVVFTNFAQAIELVKKLDRVTLGVPKIIYLVGWQNNGHDDRYPDMFELNEALKRPEDATAMDSLNALIEVGKQNHTVISFHTNFTDLYKESALFSEYEAAGAVQRNRDGEIFSWEDHEECHCYKVSYKEFYETGLFKRVADRFLECIPVQQAGTVHIDNMQTYNCGGPDVSMKEQIIARNKILDYFIEKGIDVTSEGIWREKEDEWQGWPSYDNTKPMHCLGRIAASWWYEYANDREYLNTPVSLHTGGIDRSPYGNVYYGNIHGEEIWKECGASGDGWVEPFGKQFATVEVPYLYLNTFRRTKIDTGVDQDGHEYKIGFFTGDVISFGDKKMITKGGTVLKTGNDLCLPFAPQKGTYFAYSESGNMSELYLPGCSKETVSVYEVTPYGSREVCVREVSDCRIDFAPEAGKSYFIR